MFNHCQDFDGRIVLTQQTDRLGIPGFEKFLFFILAFFSLFWFFYLRHFAPHALPVDEARTFEIELRRYKPDPVPALPQLVEPDLVEPDLVEPGLVEPRLVKPELSAPEIKQIPAASEKSEQGEQHVLKKKTQTQLLEQALELYRAENSEPVDIPDPEDKYRPDNVFDPRLADRIASIREKNSRRHQAANRLQDEEAYFDSMGILNYRKGNTCFQSIEIPGIGEQWYAGKCAITHHDKKIELNEKR